MAPHSAANNCWMAVTWRLLVLLTTVGWLLHGACKGRSQLFHGCYMASPSAASKCWMAVYMAPPSAANNCWMAVTWLLLVPLTTVGWLLTWRLQVPLTTLLTHLPVITHRKHWTVSALRCRTRSLWASSQSISPATST